MTMEGPRQYVSALGDESERSMSSAVARVLSAVHIVLYIVSTALVVDRATAYWTADQVHVVVAMITCLATAHVTGNCLSLALIFTRRSKREAPMSCLVLVACVLTHVLQMGPIWRCLTLASSGETGDIADLSLVRVVMSLLNDAPFVVLQASLMFRAEHATWSPVVATVVTFCVLLYSISVHNISRTRLKHPGSSLQLNLCRTTGLFISHTLVLASRCLALAVFFSTRGYWLVVLLGVHCLVVVLALYVRNEFTRQKRPVNAKVLLGWSVQLVEWVEVSHEPTRRDLALFYSILGVESFVVAITFAFLTDKYPVNYIVGGVIIITFVIGVGLRMLMYRMNLSDKNVTIGNDKTDMSGTRHHEIRLSEEIGKIPKEAVNKHVPRLSPRKAILIEHKKMSKRKEHRHSIHNRKTINKNPADKVQSPEPASVDDSGFHSKTDDSLMAMASDLQARGSKCTAEVHVSPLRAGHRSHYSSLDEVNVTISEFDLDFTDTSKILPTSTPKAKSREEKRPGGDTDEIIRDLQEAYHEEHLQVKQHPADQDDKRDSGIHCTDKDTRDKPSSEARKDNLSASSRTSESYTRARSCTDTCCDVCDDVSTSLTSSSDFDSLDLAVLDLTKTWPPSKKPTIENIEDLPKYTIPSRELVVMWLSKCPDHGVKQNKNANEPSSSVKTTIIM